MTTVAILGATGVVGREMLNTLLSRKFPASEIVLLASERSEGKIVECQGQRFVVKRATPDCFKGIDIVLASAGATTSKELLPHAVKAGAVAIDNSSAYRYEPEIPLVVPEVNAHDLENHQGVIANPNCSTAQLVVALQPLRKLGNLKRVVVATYQSVSGAGKAAIDELKTQTQDVLNGKDAEAKALLKPIAFNLIPQIDVFLDNGYTKEEMKLTWESRKIMGIPDLMLSATAVRVPVMIGHSEAVQIEFDREVSPEAVREALSQAPGVRVVDDPSQLLYPQPTDAAGRDEVMVGRIRADISHPAGIAMWVVGDNLRKGAALNAVQIAETLIEKGLLRRNA